jgi:hypothetical protein
LGQLTPTVTPVVDQFGIVKNMSLKPLEKKGSIYLNDEWFTASIFLKKGVFAVDKIEDIQIKLDLTTNTIEVNTHEGIKVLSHAKVDRFEWFNPAINAVEVYTNCSDYTLNGTRFDHFCTIYGNKLKLVKHSYVEVQKADYNVALDVGSKEDRYIKRSKFYLLKEEQLFECTKKSLYSMMSDKEDEMKQFVRKNRLSFSEEADLKFIIDHYNSISRGSTAGN